MIRDSQCWDRRTLKRGALHRKKLGGKDQNFRDHAKTAAESAQYLDKFHGEMTHIWQGPGWWSGLPDYAAQHPIITASQSGRLLRAAKRRPWPRQLVRAAGTSAERKLPSFRTAMPGHDEKTKSQDRHCRGLGTRLRQCR
jgi:hypothetical protein